MNNFLIATAQNVQATGLSQELKESLNQSAYEPNIFGVVLSLLIVVGLIYLTGFFYQKLIKMGVKITKNDTQKDGVNEIKIITGATLGQGKNLHIVEVNKKYFLLGATPNNISLLKEFSPEELDDEN